MGKLNIRKQFNIIKKLKHKSIQTDGKKTILYIMIGNMVLYQAEMWP